MNQSEIDRIKTYCAGMKEGKFYCHHQFNEDGPFDLPAAIAEIERLKAELEAIRDTADSVVAARAKVELPPDSPLNAAVFCLAKAFRDIGRGLET